MAKRFDKNASWNRLYSPLESGCFHWGAFNTWGVNAYRKHENCWVCLKVPFSNGLACPQFPMAGWVIKRRDLMSSRVCATGHIKDPLPPWACQMCSTSRALCPGGRFRSGLLIILITAYIWSHFEVAEALSFCLPPLIKVRKHEIYIRVSMGRHHAIHPSLHRRIHTVNNVFTRNKHCHCHECSGQVQLVTITLLRRPKFGLNMGQAPGTGNRPC